MPSSYKEENRRVKAERDVKQLQLFRDKGRLLDVGCGAGVFLQVAQKKGFQVHGLEPNPEAAQYAVSKGNFSVDCNDLEENLYENSTFDILTMYGIIEHLCDPNAALEECSRILRSRGLLVLQTPTEDGLLRRTGRLIYTISLNKLNSHAKQFYTRKLGGHTQCFTKRSIQKILTKHGFRVIKRYPSTYGLSILLRRYYNENCPKRKIKSLVLVLVYTAGLLIRRTNHLTVFAESTR